MAADSNTWLGWIYVGYAAIEGPLLGIAIQNLLDDYRNPDRITFRLYEQDGRFEIVGDGFLSLRRVERKGNKLVGYWGRDGAWHSPWMDGLTEGQVRLLCAALKAEGKVPRWLKSRGW